jgi:hypothetical protein
MASIDLGRGKSADAIRRAVLDAYAARGWEPPTDFTRLSRVLSAATATQRRKAKLLLEGARGIRDAKRWFEQAKADSQAEDSEESD